MKPARVTARRLWSILGQSDLESAATMVRADGSASAPGPAIADSLGDGPRVEQVPDTIRIGLDGQTLARSTAALRIVWGRRAAAPDEGPQAASYFLPVGDVDMSRLHPSDREGWSDWGGRIAYFHLIGSKGLVRDAVWFHPEPRPALEAIRMHLAFFARSVDEVWVGRQRLSPGADTPQGGWALPRDAVRVRPV